MKLITDDVYYSAIASDYLTKIYGSLELVGETQEGKLTAYPYHSFNRSISFQHDYYDRDGVKSINNKNAYEVLYSYLRLPISTILSSINEVNTHLPCNMPFDDALCSKIEKTQQDSPIQQILTRKRKY